MTVFTEARHPGEAILSEANGGRSREAVAIPAGVAVKACQVLGKLIADGAWDASAAAKAGGNTGDGVFTLATPKTGTGRKAGVYQVRVTGGAFSAAKTDIAGKGAITLANPAFDAGTVKVGAYKVIFIEPATDAGDFLVEDPDGIVVGHGTVGQAFDGPVKFTIADAGTDFAAGDTALITITAAVPANGLGSFSVTDPDGVALVGGTIGSAYDGAIKFTWADGGTNMIVGDGYDVTVTQADASGEYKPLDPSATDGSQVAAALAIYPLAADETDRKIAAITDDATLNGNCLEWPAGITTDQKAAAITQLREHGIKVR